MFYFLKVDDSLDALCERIAKEAGRPVYATGMMDVVRKAWYSKPGVSGYQQYTPLDLFLTPLASKTFTEHEDGRLCCDLNTPGILRLAAPLMPKEDSLKFPHFKPENVESGAFSTFVELRESDPVPEELRPFVQERYNRRQNRHETVIVFVVSQSIYAPMERHDRWHLDYRYEAKNYTTTSIRPPGQYSGTIGYLMDANCMAVYETAPGQCTVCRGASGERKHLGIMDASGGAGKGGVFPRLLICKGCAAESMTQILSLLNE